MTGKEFCLLLQGQKEMLVFQCSDWELIRIDSESFSYLSCLSCQNMFQVESVNCICVDWKSGSRTGYTQASQNTRIVGAEVAYFVEVLQVTFVCNIPCMLLSGFSSKDGNNDSSNTVIWRCPSLEKNLKKNLDLGFNDMPMQVNRLVFLKYSIIQTTR